MNEGPSHMHRQPPLEPQEIATLRRQYATASHEHMKDVRYVLGSFARRPVRTPRALIDLHDLLLFISAFPRHAGDSALAASELERLAGIAARMVERNATHRHILTNTGIAGTPAQANYGIDLTRWLVTAEHEHVSLDSLDGEKDQVRNVLVAIAPAAEQEALEDERHDVLARVMDAGGGSPLAWLVKAIDASTSDHRLRHTLWEACRPTIAVHAERSRLTRTWCRGIAPVPYHFTDGLRAVIDPRAVIERPLDPPLPLTDDQREHLLGAARGVLIGHLRETDTATLCDPRHIDLHDLGMGLNIALLHLPPGRRTLYDGYVGYVLFSAAVPVAYGGAWMFPGKTKVGINVFPAFRGGPSNLLFGQILRCYRQRYRVGCFEAENYQIGHGNPDGIRSGAYWFYHRMGFRTSDPDLVPIERAEHERMMNDRHHRTPVKVLRKLASRPMRLLIEPEPFPLFEPADLSEAVFKAFNAHPGGERRAALTAIIPRVMEALGIGDLDDWSDEGRHALTALAPALHLVRDLGSWPRPEKDAVIALVRSKGAATEDRYISLLRKLPRLLQHLAEAAEA
jgi:hypothetical protein